jgi:5-formyltetrahydrofolate cyclo-ligase
MVSLTYNKIMQPTKTALRRKLKQERLALTEREHSLLSLAIANRLRQALDWYDILTIHFFQPIVDLKEVDISEFTRLLPDDHDLYTSRKVGDEWKIVSVSGETAAEVPEFEAVIVPMLGFDRHLHRVGYGGGYYDKLLATQSQAIKIGVCFELGRLDSIPAEGHDIALDLIVTEDSIYRP